MTDILYFKRDDVSCSNFNIFIFLLSVILVALSVASSSGKLMFMLMPSNIYSYSIITFAKLFYYPIPSNLLQRYFSSIKMQIKEISLMAHGIMVIGHVFDCSARFDKVIISVLAELVKAWFSRCISISIEHSMNTTPPQTYVQVQDERACSVPYACA